jgi:hypothetical protein
MLSFLIIHHAQASSLEFELKPEKIINEIESRGAKEIVKELCDNGDNWITVLKEISSGHPSWIKVAVKLLEGTDAGTTSMLEIAMFLALEVSPDLVLKASTLDESYGMKFPINQLCSSNFLIDYPLNHESLQMIIKRRKSLEKVSDPELTNKKNKCINRLDNEILRLEKKLPK